MTQYGKKHGFVSNKEKNVICLGVIGESILPYIKELYLCWDLSRAIDTYTMGKEMYGFICLGILMGNQECIDQYFTDFEHQCISYTKQLM